MAVLYRDVYYVTTPAAMWIMQLAVQLFGTNIRVERALASACITASILLVCSVAKGAGIGRLGRVVVGGAVFVYGAPVAHFASVYSMLAITLALGALVTTIRWADRTAIDCSIRSSPLLLAGMLCGASFATKPNTGILALGAVALTVSIAARRAGVPRWRSARRVVTGFVVPVTLMVAAIVGQGAWNAFVSDVFTGKSSYLQLLGAHPTQVLAYALHVIGDPSLSLARRIHVGVVFLPAVALVVIVWTRVVSRRPRSTTHIACLAFTIVGLGAAAPDFGFQHVTEAIPLLLGMPVVALASLPRSTHAWAPRSRAVLVTLSAVLLVTAGTATLSSRRPTITSNDRVVAARFPAFAGTMISSVNERNVDADLAALRARTHGVVFIVEAKAAFYYLAGGLRDPTPFDFPARTDFGRGGQAGVLTFLRRTRTRWACVRPPGPHHRQDPTEPVQLEHALTRSFRLIAHLHVCDLYTTRAGPTRALARMPAVRTE